MSKSFKPVFIYSNGDIVIGSGFTSPEQARDFLENAFINGSFINESASYDMTNVVNCLIHEV